MNITPKYIFWYHVIPDLAGHVCPVLLDNTSKMSEKISSSTIRKEKFGQLLKPVNKSKDENNDNKQLRLVEIRR